MAIEMLKSKAADPKKLRQPAAAGSSPVSLEIDGTAYRVTGLSDDGMAVVEFSGQAEPNQIIQTKLLVECDGFDLSVPALWEVIAFAPERKQLNLKLAPVNEASHLATVNTLISALVSGERISAADALEVARTSHAANDPAEHAEPYQSPARQGFKRRAGAIAFTALGAVLLGFIATNLGARALYVEADGTIMNPQSVTPLMPEDAELVSFAAAPGARVPANSPVAIVRNKAGQMLTITSPCDCAVGGQLASSRDFLRKGAPVAQLVPVDGANRAVLSLKLEELRRVRVGDEVTVRFFDSNAKVTGTVERVAPPKVLANAPARPASLNGTIEVLFANKLPAWRVGEPVTGRVQLSRLNPFA